MTAGAIGRDIGGGLPSPFGFPVAAAPGSGPAGCSVWVIPENGETIRTDDASARLAHATTAARPGHRRSTVCPRGSTTCCARGWPPTCCEPAGVYFGTTGGTLYASNDGGAHWTPIAEGLPRIQSVEVSAIS